MPTCFMLTVCVAAVIFSAAYIWGMNKYVNSKDRKKKD
jgi:hypothetical protein